jgi:hypothetical protein
MQMVSSRTIPFLDTESLLPGQAREALFRDDNGFILYLSGGLPPAVEERVVRLEMREALIWLNETSQVEGSFWAEDKADDKTGLQQGKLDD